MAEIRKASNLVEALKNFRAQPLLTEEEFEAFYVERNLRVMRRLYSDIEVSSEGKKFLVVGYRGSGKSTELRKLQMKIEKTGQFLPVLLDIERDLKYAINDLEIPELLAYMALKLIDLADNKNVKVDKEVKEKFEDIILKPIKAFVREEAINAQIGIKLIGAGAEVSKIYREEFKTKSVEVINLLDSLIQDLENKIRKPLLLLVDGTDKLLREKAEKLFRDEIQYLAMPFVRLIVLCPVALIRSKHLPPTAISYFGPPYEISQLAVWKSSVDFTVMDYESILEAILKSVSNHGLEKPLESEDAFKENGLGEYLEYNGLRFYYEVAARRMEMKLIEPEALTMLIIGTGKLSEFVAAMSNAISIARAEGEEKVKLPHVKSTLLDIRTFYEDTLSLDDKKLLIDVHAKKEISQSDEDFDRSMNLLYYNYIIRVHAREDEFWDDVDPLFYPRLKKWKEAVS